MQFQTKNSQLQHDTYTEKRHYKMFKSGKHWVVAGISLLFAGSVLFAVQPDAVHAATENPSDATSTQSQQSASADSAEQNSQSNVVPLKSGTTVSASTATQKASTDDAQQQTADTANRSNTTDSAVKTDTMATQTDKDAAAAKTTSAVKGATATKETASTTKDAASAEDIASTAKNASTADTSSQAAVDSNAQQQATADSQADPAQSTTDTSSNTAASTATTAEATTGNDSAQVTDLGSATAEQVAQAMAAAAQKYTDTQQAQTVTAALPTSDSTASIQVSADKVGFGTTDAAGNALTSLLISYSINNAAAGDVYSVTTPADNAVLEFPNKLQYAALATDQGTTVLTQNADGTRTITSTFVKDVNGITTLSISYNLKSNYNWQSKPIATIGKTQEQVTIAKNGTVVDSADFTTNVQAAAKPTPVTKLQLASSTDTSVVPGVAYVYNFAVNEVSGVMDDHNYSTLRVNSAVNYGTTITIPVPAGFTLDAATTAAVNAFSDQTVITQAGGAGGDITISVPKGSGVQNADKGAGTDAYKLIGTFAATQTAAEQTLSASGVATMVQRTDDAGTTYTASTADPWTVTLAGTGDAVSTASASVILRGNSSSSPTLLTLNDDATDDPQYLLTAGFQYQGAATSDATMNLTIPDGFNATAVQVPNTASSSTTYLPDTTSYEYSMTLADGSVQTGTVAAGEKVTSTGAAIRSISLKPNALSGWSSTGKLGPTGALNLNDGSFFEVIGTLASTYDDGTAVQNGDTLTATASFSVPGADAVTQSATQTVTTPVSVATAYVAQTSEQAGMASGYIAVLGSNIQAGMTTAKIFEPILYYVLPSAVTVDSVTGTQDATVTQSLSADGRIIVTIDYTGTGESVDMNIPTGENNVVKVTNNADAMSGNYPYELYIYSPNTELTQKTVTTDPALTGGHADAVEMGMNGGNWNWKILQATTTAQFTHAQGDDAAPVQNATVDKNSSAQLSFDANILNTNGAVDGAALVVNLPTTGDDRGSQYTFNLSGPVTLPSIFNTTTGKTVALSGTVLYSTTRNALSASSTAADLTGYVSADQITDWSTVRSVLIKLDALPKEVATGRITFAGTVADMVHLGQKTGTIETGLYLGGLKVSVDHVADAATLEITGSSTIKARAHYVDADGNDQYVYFPDSDQTLLDNTDTIPDPSTLSLSADDLAQLPTGYQLASAPASYVDSKTDGAPVAGATVTNADDGDYLQFELVPKDVTLCVQYVDEDTKALVTVPSTTKTIITGKPGTTGTYTAVVPTGYVLAEGQSATPTYTLAADSNAYTLEIKLQHVLSHNTLTTTRIINYVYADGGQAAPTVTQTMVWKSVTDEVDGQTVYTAQNAYYVQTSPTITGYLPSQDEVSQLALGPTTATPTNAETVLVTYTATTQTATINFVTTDGVALGSVAVSGAAGSAIPASAYQEKLSTLTAANYTVQTNNAAGAKFDTDSSQPQSFDIVMNAPVTRAVRYVDETDGSSVTVPNAATSVRGALGSTGSYTVVVPEHYALGQTQSASVDYTLSHDAQDIIIHLTHQVAHSTTTTTRTINYVVADNGASTPASVTQKLNWKITTDLVTGAIVATPQGSYVAVASPTVTGFTPDRASVASETPSATTTAPANATEQIVTYTVDTQQATINFVTTDGVGLGSVAVTGASGSDIPASAYQEKLAELIADDYTLQTNNAADAQFDTDSAQPQSFEIVMHAPVTLNVSYIDDADGRAITVAGALHTLSGAQGTSGSYTVRVPEHYDLAKGQAAVVDYTLSADAAPIVIHLTHQVAYSEVMTTRTINYVVTDNGAAAPASVMQKLNWKIATDLVTGATVATPQGAYGAVVSPTVTGFTPDQARVASSTPSARTSRPANAANQTVTYTADTQRATIKFVATDGKALGTLTVSGPSGSAIAMSSYAQKLTALEAQGYSVVSDGTADAHFDTDSTRDQEFEVVFRPASSTDNGGGTTTNNGGGTTTDNGGGTTTNNAGGTTTGNPGNGNDTPQNLPSTFDDGSGATKSEGDAKTETTGTNSKVSGEQALPVTGGVTANAAQTIQQAAAKQNVLPQTGDDNGSVLTILGVGLAGLLSIFGLARKRQHEDD